MSTYALNSDGALVDADGNPAQDPPGWTCPKCGIDRTKQACPQGHSAALTGHCPMVGSAAQATQTKAASGAVAVAWYYPDGRPYTLTWAGDDEKRMAEAADRIGLRRVQLCGPVEPCPATGDRA